MNIKWVGWRYLIFIALLVAVWYVWDTFQSKNWISSTYPADGATSIPRDVTIAANWKGARSNNLGMSVRYMDTPEEYIPGRTTAWNYGISFEPEGEFAPGRKVKVTVEVGRRMHTFTFTTVDK